MELIKWSPFDHVEGYTITRKDGYSKGDLQGLNLSFNVQDDPNLVLKNRQKLCDYLNTDFDHLVATRQTHSTNLLKVTKKDGGKGIYSDQDAFYNYDAMYTRDKDLWLLSFHADCTPVLLYNQKEELICEIHSGWKGTVHEITRKVVTKLIEEENCDPQSFYCYIGPSIEQRNFEIGQDVVDLIQQMSFDASDFYQPKGDGKYLFNAKGLVKKQLLLCDIPEENITVSPYCTIENPDLFYSYRKNKKCGRNVTMIKMK